MSPDTGWTSPEQDEWTAEDEVDEMDLAPYDEGTEPDTSTEPDPSLEPYAVGPEPVAADVVDTGVDDLGI